MMLDVYDLGVAATGRWPGWWVDGWVEGNRRSFAMGTNDGNRTQLAVCSWTAIPVVRAGRGLGTGTDHVTHACFTCLGY